MTAHYNITVKGHVQGVGFRYSTLTMSRYYKIKGFIRNNNDGSVYIEAEGDEIQLRQFIIWCRKGPDSADITEVIVEKNKLCNYTSFEIRRY
jgi:acylphosphatase